MKYCQNPLCYMYDTQDRLRGTKGNKVYRNRKRSEFYYANGNFCSLRCQDDWFQEYGNACIDFVGRITISPERPEDSVSYWSIRNNFAKQIESELTREGLTYADSKYWTERHRRISQRTRDYFRQQREEVVNG